MPVYSLIKHCRIPISVKSRNYSMNTISQFLEVFKPVYIQSKQLRNVLNAFTRLDCL